MSAFEDLLKNDEILRSAALRRTQNASDAEDVLQDVWLAVLQAPKSLRGRELPWLRSLVRNLSVSRFRSEAARRRREEEVARQRKETLTESENTGLRLGVVDAIFKLPELFRQCIALRYFADLSPAEIAEHLGIPAATVRTRIHRGLKQIREEMGVKTPERRHAVLALLFPGLLRRALLRRVATIAAGLVAIVGVGALMFSLRPEPSSSSESWLSSEIESVPVAARREPAPGYGSSPMAETEGKNGPAVNQAARHTLRGRISVRLEGKSQAAPLSLIIWPFLTGAANEFASLVTGDHLDEPITEPGQVVALEAGSTFEVVVAKGGRYRAWVEVKGVAGGKMLFVDTDRELDKTLDLLPRLDIQVTSQLDVIRAELLRVEALTSLGRNPLNAELMRPGHWRVAGPLMPGLRLTLKNNGLQWEELAYESLFQIDSPRSRGTMILSLRDASSGRSLTGARLQLRTWNRDSRERLFDLVVKRDGTSDFPLMARAETAFDDRLEIQLMTGERFVLDRMNGFLTFLQGKGVKEVRIEFWPRSGAAGRLVDGEGAEIAAAVLVLQGEGKVLRWAETDAKGQFNLPARGDALATLINAKVFSDHASMVVGVPPGPRSFIAVHARHGYLQWTPKGNEESDLVVPWVSGRVRQLAVVDSQTNEPVKGAYIWLGSWTKKGSVLLSGKPRAVDERGKLDTPRIQGQWGVHVEAAGYKATDLEIQKEGLTTVALLRSESPVRVEQSFDLETETGEPIRDVRIALYQVKGSEIVRSTSNDEGLAKAPLMHGVEYQLRVYAPGRRLSLQQPRSFRADGKTLKVRVCRSRALRFRIVREAGLDFDPRSSFLAIIMKSASATGTHRGAFVEGSMRPVVLNCEPQRLVFYRSGCLPLAREIDPSQEQLGLSLAFERGLRVTVILGASVERALIRFVPLAIALDGNDDAAMNGVRDRMMVDAPLHAGTSEPRDLIPGRYRVELVVDEVVVRQREYLIVSDREIRDF
ncbi:MAG: RNA polymerase sigma factor [Planctomycetota bacterium]